MIESEMSIATCLYWSMADVGDNMSTVQRTESKEIENGFLGLSFDTPRYTQWTRLFSSGGNNLLSPYICNNQYLYRFVMMEFKRVLLLNFLCLKRILPFSSYSASA